MCVWAAPLLHRRHQLQPAVPLSQPLINEPTAHSTTGWPHRELCRNSGTHTGPNTHRCRCTHSHSLSWAQRREREKERKPPSPADKRSIRPSDWYTEACGLWGSPGHGTVVAEIQLLLPLDLPMHSSASSFFFLLPVGLLLSWWSHPSLKLLVSLRVLTSVLISDKFCCGKVCNRILTTPAFDPPLPRFSSFFFCYSKGWHWAWPLFYYSSRTGTLGRTRTVSARWQALKINQELKRTHLNQVCWRDSLHKMKMSLSQKKKEKIKCKRLPPKNYSQE